MIQTLNTQEHWAAEYIGKPWKANSRGPNSFDCYGLVWYDYLQHGIRLPLFAGVDPKDDRLVSVCVEECRNKSEWIQLELPIERCVVLMSRDGERFTHMGLYTAEKGGSVVHAYDNSAVHCSPIRGLGLLGIQKVEYYEWVALRS